MEFLSRQRRWLLPALLILLILEVLTLPIVLSLTYAGKSKSPDHIITYRPHVLKWDDSTTVRPDGSGELTLFDTVYQNVHSDNSDKMLAPGTGGDNTVRLKNEADNEVKYTTTLYTIRSTDNLPVAAAMDGDGEETDRYVLPKGVDASSVVKTLTGSLKSGEIADFDIDWYWLYEVSDAQDVIDTAFGDDAAWEVAEDVLMGVYIIVEDDGSYAPEPPVTGDNAMIYGYVCLFAISLLLLIFTIPFKRKKQEPEA